MGAAVVTVGAAVAREIPAPTRGQAKGDRDQAPAGSSSHPHEVNRDGSPGRSWQDGRRWAGSQNASPRSRNRRPSRSTPGQGAEGGGRGRHRLRRRRARFPDARPHRRGGRRRVPRPPEPPVHADAGPAGAARGDRAQDQARLRLRLRGRAGARHQRRQARRVQHVPGVAAIRATRCCARRRTGRPIRRRSRSPAACRSSSADDGGHRIPGHGRAARSGAAHRAPRRCCSCRRATRPARCIRRKRSRRSGGGRVERGIWVDHRRDLRAPDVRRAHAFTSMPALVPELAERCVDPQRRREDLRDDRVARRLDDRARRRHRGGHQPAVALHVERLQRRAGAPRSPRCSGDLDAVGEMRDAFERRGQHDAQLLSGIPGVSCLEPRARSTASRRSSGVLGREIAGRTPATTLELCEVLLDEAKVAIVPGEAFGAPGYAPPLVRARRRRPRRRRAPHRRRCSARRSSVREEERSDV